MMIGKIKTLALIAALSVGLSAPAFAKVSADEAAKLGKELTPLGAEMAGNADGSIPAWDGGITEPPANYVPGDFRPDPYVDDKPLYTITAANMAEHKDKLSPGQQAMFNKYPDTYRMDIYPTRRSHAAPQWVYDNTKANATRAELVGEGSGVSGAYGGTPFPIPANAEEVVWNHILQFRGEGSTWEDYSSYFVKPSGKIVTTVGAEYWDKYPYYEKDGSLETFNQEHWNLFMKYTKPARRKGEVLVLRDPIDQTENPRKAWQYLVGQRRVRRAPTVAYDTPNPGLGGLGTYDDAYVFNGALDRFDWKLVGKKEQYIPYNSYRINGQGDPEVILPANHVNPDFMRWELHRVWVVEATLKEGKRHIYGKRVFFADEDSWIFMEANAYDNQGELWRVVLNTPMNVYEVPATYFSGNLHFDLNSGEYIANAFLLDSKKPRDFFDVAPSSFFTPEQIRRQGKR